MPGGLNMEPLRAIATTDNALGSPLEVSVVPSIGSTATSTPGGLPLPTRSPMYSIGASSFSPSPMTTTPSMSTLFSVNRIAVTAAWSAAFLSPRPIQRAAASAAASVTRASSNARLRSRVGRDPPRVVSAAAIALLLSPPRRPAGSAADVALILAQRPARRRAQRRRLGEEDVKLVLKTLRRGSGRAIRNGHRHRRGLCYTGASLRQERAPHARTHHLAGRCHLHPVRLPVGCVCPNRTGPGLTGRSLDARRGHRLSGGRFAGHGLGRGERGQAGEHVSQEEAGRRGAGRRTEVAGAPEHGELPSAVAAGGRHL